MADSKQLVTAHVRLACPADVPHILALIRELAEFEHLTKMCVATESKLESSLFKQPPFQGPTIFVLEVTRGASTNDAEIIGSKEHAFEFEEVCQELELRSAIKDPQAHAFRSIHGEGRTVVGFVLFFPNYSTFLAKPGFYIEDLFVRECYRGQGFGTILLKTVAKQALKLNYGRVEWCVLDWNENAIKFYEGIGAKVLQDWRICRLTGTALENCGS